MLANAVSSALDRFYAAGPTGEDRVSPVQRVTAVNQGRGAGSNGSPDGHVDRDERERSSQRQALTQGVRAVFESSSSGETKASISGSGQERSEAAKPAPEQKPDPQLEAAILRFIHTVFRSLAEAEGVPAAQDNTDSSSNDAATAAVSALGANASRSALGARIGALAQRYADAVPTAASAAGNPQSAGTTAAGLAPDSALSQAFDEVMQAMHGTQDGVDASQSGKGDLVNLMQRLAQAMQGAPPVDPGLPTRGGLLSTRA